MCILPLDSRNVRRIFSAPYYTAKSLARPGKKQARKHVRDARDFSNFETRSAIKFFFSSPLQGKAPKAIHAILTETLACFLPGRAKDLSAPLYFAFGLRGPAIFFSTLSHKRQDFREKVTEHKMGVLIFCTFFFFCLKHLSF